MAKGVFAFAVTYLVANHLSKEDFGLWATLFSIATMLGVSELGVGQLILTTFHERGHSREEGERLVANAVAAMAGISLVLLFGLAIANTDGRLLGTVRWSGLLLAIILLRLVAAPHAAYLSALERYHERKVVEALTYGVAALAIAACIHAGRDISVLLLTINVVITAGSAIIWLRARQLGIPRVQLSVLSASEMRRIFTASFPYFVSNVSSLTTYAGFIALSAMVLNAVQIARISLLHTLLLMHAMQLFELLFKTVQPRMQDPVLMRRLRLMVAGSFALAILGAATVGPWVIETVFRQYHYSTPELVAYTCFVFLEIYYLLITSAMQMRSAMRSRLQWISIIKAGVFGVVLLAGSLVNHSTLVPYTILLVIYSAVMGLLAWRLSA